MIFILTSTVRSLSVLYLKSRYLFPLKLISSLLSLFLFANSPQFSWVKIVADLRLRSCLQLQMALIWHLSILDQSFTFYYYYYPSYFWCWTVSSKLKPIIIITFWLFLIMQIFQWSLYYKIIFVPVDKRLEYSTTYLDQNRFGIEFKDSWNGWCLYIVKKEP